MALAVARLALCTRPLQARPLLSQARRICLQRPHITGSQFQRRNLSATVTRRSENKPADNPVTPATDATYAGPLTTTFRRLKIFSFTSLGLTTALAPFIFIVESSLPFSARIALASIAFGTSGTSTALVSWCGKPYVTTLRRMKPEENDGAGGLEMTTFTLFLSPRITRVYDENFLVETRRPFAKWELAGRIVLPANKTAEVGQEETVAETMDKDGQVIGRWVVKWGEGGEGVCHEVGNVNRYFNVHEELLS